MSADTLIARLSHVRVTGSGRWLALCPAHPDRSPSLSIREVDDGLVLIKCFAGCGAIDVLDSLGLDWAALFPENGHKPALATRSRIPSSDLLKIIREETLVVAIMASDMLSGRTISETDWRRLSLAVGRIELVANYAHR
jgi:hypothetical protein